MVELKFVLKRYVKETRDFLRLITHGPWDFFRSLPYMHCGYDSEECMITDYKEDIEKPRANNLEKSVVAEQFENPDKAQRPGEKL